MEQEEKKFSPRLLPIIDVAFAMRNSEEGK